MRILLQAALEKDGLLSIANVAAAHAISRNHAMKVVQTLSQAGLLETVRGRGGGFRLGRPAGTITLGEVVRLTEPGLRVADCASCVLRDGCGLTPLLDEATSAFLGALDARTLEDAARSSEPARFASAAKAGPSVQD